MNLRPSTVLGSVLTLTLVVGACTHTPPGTSVEIALAKRAEMVRLPATPTPAPALHAPSSERMVSQADLPSGAEMDRTEKVAEAFGRGRFCMEAGKDEEAIAAFQEVVKIDPSFTDAWNYLAALYEKTGQEKQALLAFKKSKLAHE